MMATMIQDLHAAKKSLCERHLHVAKKKGITNFSICNPFKKLSLLR